jgi:hypothetical protein
MTLSGIERDFLNRVLLQDWTSPPLFDHRLLDRLVEARYITRQSAALAFGTAWREYLPGRSEADFDAWRQDAAWHAAKYARWDRHHTGTNSCPPV